MGTIVVVVVDEFPQDGYQVALVDHDQVVQALDPNRSHDSFGDRIGVRRPTWGLHAEDAHGSSPRIEVPAVDSVAIVDQMRRLTSPSRGLDQLPPDPRGGRARGDVEMDQLSAAWLMKTIT